MLRRLKSLLVLAVALLVLSNAGGKAEAQTQVDASNKGLIGLGLIGAELGLVIPSAFGYTETWSLVTLPVVGAAGGAVGGYYLDRANSPAASISVLALGLAFAVPTVMITVSATRYSTRDLERDSRTSRRSSGRLFAGTGFLRRYDGGWHFGAPDIGVSPVRHLADDGRLATNGVDVRLSLLSGAF